MGVTVNEHKVSCPDYENVLKLESGDHCKVFEYSRNEWYTLKSWRLYVNYISMQLLYEKANYKIQNCSI